MKKLAENLWVLPYPLRLLGANFARMVTIVRPVLATRHSLHGSSHLQMSLVSCAWATGLLLEAMLQHDTLPAGAVAVSQNPLSNAANLYEIVGFPDCHVA